MILIYNLDRSFFHFVTNHAFDRQTDSQTNAELLASAATELRIMALIDDGGANWGCYGPSLVPVLPQASGDAQQSAPPAPPTLRP